MKDFDLNETVNSMENMLNINIHIQIWFLEVAKESWPECGIWTQDYRILLIRSNQLCYIFPKKTFLYFGMDADQN